MTILPLALIVLAAVAAAQPQTPEWVTGRPGSDPGRPVTHLRVVMLVDTSGSMTNDVPFRRGDRTFLTDARAGLHAAIRPEESRSIETFGDGGASPLWDALDGVVRSLDGASGRRAILVVTDGRATGNRLAFAEILLRLRQARVPVFFICAERPKDVEVADPSIRLRQLATASGGQYAGIKNNLGIRPTKPAEIRRAIADAVDAMRKGTRAGG
jgi:hypothetical protein